MAELAQDGGGKGKHKGGPKQRKKSTRIDMTAMVDVAFLLLTFFILTTTMATPQAMVVNKPPENKDDKDPDTKMKVREEKILTVILGANDKIHYYKGITDPEIKTTNYSATGIRKVIINHLEKYPNRCPEGAKGEEIKATNCWDPIVVIKANKTAKYMNLVDILDEMAIIKVKKFAYTEITSMDSTLLADFGKK